MTSPVGNKCSSWKAHLVFLVRLWRLKGHFSMPQRRDCNGGRRYLGRGCVRKRSRRPATRRLVGTPWGFSRYESDINTVPLRGAVVNMRISSREKIK
ncbi:jg26454 [Pararge aegeria aegeria]|uniref:Jg26454 protein n=1 Tax=Pararge aegeria aegeria TaxID=348720 RepID=A0A8S4QU58_9NEOP|nr:jg26454 [Pararge aegeria aegeria]